MKKKLADIRQPIAAHLKQFESHFRDAMRSKAPLLDRITYYIVQRKGKQMRPMFVFLAADIIGEISSSTYHAACQIELLHTATLVHDDVVDDAYQRRGFFSVNALWKNKIAVLVGDFMFSRGMLMALREKEFYLFEIVSRAVEAMSEGELLQMEKARRLDIKEDVYYEIIRQKTATLIAASCEAGAASATEDRGVSDTFRAFGEKIGMAFQIRDDLFDFGTADVGKPRGIDIKEKKLTLPLIYALQHATRSDRRRMLRNISKHNEDPAKVAEVIDFVHQSGGLAYAKKVMLEYRREAFELLHQFPDSPSRRSMEDLVRFVTDREK